MALELLPTSGVVITGGASGIGLATAHAVAEVGRPVAIWDLHPERAPRPPRQWPPSTA